MPGETTPLILVAVGERPTEQASRWETWLRNRHVRVEVARRGAKGSLPDGIILTTGALNDAVDAFYLGCHYGSGVPMWPVPDTKFTKWWNRVWAGYMTPIERDLGQHLTDFFGSSGFRTQWPVGPYRPDFIWCNPWPFSAKGRVIVECDGVTYHSDPQKVIADKKRDRWFTENGFKVLRFSTPELQDADACVDQIARTLGVTV